MKSRDFTLQCPKSKRGVFLWYSFLNFDLWFHWKKRGVVFMPIYLGAIHLGHLCMCIEFRSQTHKFLPASDASSFPCVSAIGVQEQRDLERKYEELIAARGQLKGLCNKAHSRTWAQLQLGIWLHAKIFMVCGRLESGGVKVEIDHTRWPWWFLMMILQSHCHCRNAFGASTSFEASWNHAGPW